MGSTRRGGPWGLSLNMIYWDPIRCPQYNCKGSQTMAPGGYYQELSPIYLLAVLTGPLLLFPTSRYDWLSFDLADFVKGARRCPKKLMKMMSFFFSSSLVDHGERYFKSSQGVQVYLGLEGKWCTPWSVEELREGQIAVESRGGYRGDDLSAVPGRRKQIQATHGQKVGGCEKREKHKKLRAGWGWGWRQRTWARSGQLWV